MKCRQFISPGQQLIDMGTTTEQRDQRALGFHDDRAALLPDLLRVTDELQGVAQSLFGMQQNGLIFERSAVPERLSKIALSR
jgi:hypothetical protein